MRTITAHHDGHGLNEEIRIDADDRDLGGASHQYEFWMKGGKALRGTLQFQQGARHEASSTSGITDQALVAVVIDRLQGFQAGPFACRENAIALTKLQECLFWMRHRADERAARGVLGKNQQ